LLLNERNIYNLHLDLAAILNFLKFKYNWSANHDVVFISFLKVSKVDFFYSWIFFFKNTTWRILNCGNEKNQLNSKWSPILKKWKQKNVFLLKSIKNYFSKLQTAKRKKIKMANLFKMSEVLKKKPYSKTRLHFINRTSALLIIYNTYFTNLTKNGMVFTRIRSWDLSHRKLNPYALFYLIT
jgi:hypothetical protein